MFLAMGVTKFLYFPRVDPTNSTTSSPLYSLWGGDALSTQAQGQRASNQTHTPCKHRRQAGIPLPNPQLDPSQHLPSSHVIHFVTHTRNDGQQKGNCFAGWIPTAWWTGTFSLEMLDWMEETSDSRPSPSIVTALLDQNRCSSIHHAGEVKASMAKLKSLAIGEKA